MQRATSLMQPATSQMQPATLALPLPRLLSRAFSLALLLTRTGFQGNHLRASGSQTSFHTSPKASETYADLESSLSSAGSLSASACATWPPRAGLAHVRCSPPFATPTQPTPASSPVAPNGSPWRTSPPPPARLYGCPQPPALLWGIDCSLRGAQEELWANKKLWLRPRPGP